MSTPPEEAVEVVEAVARITRIDAASGVWHVLARCPLCGRQHTHSGGPTGEPPTRATDKQRKLWLTLDTTIQEHTRITATAARLNRLTPPQHDSSGEFAALKNLKQIWSLWQIGLTPPWANPDPRISQLTIVRLGGQMWIPTSAERDEAWLESYGGQLEQAQRNRHNLRGFAALGGTA